MTTLGRLTEPERVRRHHRQDRRRTGRSTQLRDVARIELGAKSQDQTCTLDGKPSVGPGRVPASRLQRRGHRRPRPAKMDELKRRISRTGSTTRSSTTPRRSSTSRSTRCSRPCATRSSWWRWSCWCSCRTGGRRSSRWSPCPSRWSAPSRVMALLGFSLNNISLCGPGAGDRRGGGRRDRGGRERRALDRARPVARARRPTSRWKKSPWR